MWTSHPLVLFLPVRRNLIGAPQRRSSSRQMIRRAASGRITLLDIFDTVRAEEVGSIGGEEEALPRRDGGCQQSSRPTGYMGRGSNAVMWDGQSMNTHGSSETLF